ncbi:MAG: sulfotransferase domain-containing protein, partial [Pseudomonadota bacterium]
RTNPPNGCPMRAALGADRPLIWLASYPKSGNTWLRAMLSALLNEQETVDLRALEGGMEPFDREVLDDFAAISSSELSPMELLPYQAMLMRALASEALPPCFVKTHAANIRGHANDPLFPPDVTAGAIYIIRNPLDVAVSYAHHANKDFDWVIDFMADDGGGLDNWDDRSSQNVPQLMQSWSANVLSWTDCDDFPVAILRYEDMLEDTRSCLEAVAEFCRIESTPTALDAAIEACRFEALQARESETGFPEKPSADRPFFRAGRTGDGLRLLSANQIARVVKDHAGVMQTVGYDISLTQDVT